MLSGPLEDPVYLLDPGVSRAGGAPVWIGNRPPRALVADPAASDLSSARPPLCALCQRPLWLVAQVFAPFGQWRRALHIFGCNNVRCSTRNTSWRCFRTQELWPEEENTPSVPLEVDDAAAPYAASVALEAAPISVAVSDEASDESDNEWDVAEEEGADKTAAVDGAIAELLARQAQMNGASSPEAAPPSHSALSTAAAAVSDAPSRKPSDQASALSTAASLEWNGPQFPCEWLYETPEPWEDHNLKNTRAKKSHSKADSEANAMASKLDAFLAAADPNDEATARLRSALAANPENSSGNSRSGSNSSSNNSSNSSSSSSVSGGGGSGAHSSKGRKGGSSSADKDEDGYEATPAASRALLRFQAVLRKEPNQGVRYEWGGSPLWASPQPPPQSSRVPPCPSCGAPRRFECQLMPALLFALHVDECAAATAAAASAAEITDPNLLSVASLPPPPPSATTGLSAGDSGETADAKGAAEDASAEAKKAAAELKALVGASVLAQSTVFGMDWCSVAVYSCEESCANGDEEHTAVEPPVN